MNRRSPFIGGGGDPDRHGSTVCVVLLAELPPESRFFVPVDERHDGRGDGGCIDEQLELAQDKGLAHDRCNHREIHRISDVAVQAADDEVLRRATGAGVPIPSRTKRTNALSRTATPAMTSTAPTARATAHGCSGSSTSQAGQPPRDQPDHDARRDDQEERTACGGPSPASAAHVERLRRVSPGRSSSGDGWSRCRRSRPPAFRPGAC